MLFATAVPIQPGKMERFRLLDQELTSHRAEYEALNDRFGVRAHSIWSAPQLDGTDLALNLYDIDRAGLQEMARRVWDLESPYDRWWIEWVGDVYGVDLLAPGGSRGAPRPVFEWVREDAAPSEDEER